MKVVEYRTEIKQTEVELRIVEKQQSKAKLLLRVQLLRLLKSGRFSQLKEAAVFLGISPKHGYDLWNKYKVEGLDGYLKLNYRVNSAKLGADQKAVFRRRAEQGFESQREAREFIRDECAVGYTQQGISLLFQRLKIKAKVRRPFNVKADESAQREYKKTFV